MILTYSFTVPSSPGSGPVVDLSNAVSKNREFVYKTPTANAEEVAVEVSADGVNFVAPSDLIFSMAGHRVTDASFRYARALRRTGSGAVVLRMCAEAINEIRRDVQPFTVGPDAGALSTYPEVTIYEAPTARRVIGVNFFPAGPLTADDVDYAVLFCQVRRADGTLRGLVAGASTTTTDTGDWYAFVPVSLALASAPLAFDLDAGEHLTVKTLKVGAGVQMPAGCWSVLFEV